MRTQSGFAERATFGDAQIIYKESDMTDHKFEPFQQVLVRNRNYHPWEPMHYGYVKDGEHVCAGNPYQQCIPYTSETAHLIGTSQAYAPL